jgi:alpha-mannosidase
MPEIKEILVLHHSHLDIGYTHPQPIILELQKRYLDQVLDLCTLTEEWPEESRFRWTCEAAYVVLKWLETANDRQISRFIHYLQRGQISVAASLLHSTPLCSAEQITRMLSPLRRLRRLFGIELKAAIHHDINGQPWSYGQLLLDAGVEFLMMGINIHFGGIPLTRPQAFHWQVPDGRRLLTFHGEQYSLFTQIANVAAKDTTVMAEGLTKYLQKIAARPDYPFDFVYLTATNVPLVDNNSPDRDLAPLIRRWNEEGREPKISFVTPEQLYARVQGYADQLSTYQGDWTDYWNFGSGSSALETKINRQAKRGMKAVELLDAFQAEGDRAMKEQAWENMHLYDEHTWGAYNSVSEPDSMNATVQWMHKAHPAYQAHSLTRYLLGSKLEQLTANPLQSEEPEGVMLINPSAFALTHDLRLPAGFTVKGRRLAAHRMSQDLLNTQAIESSPSYGLFTLPAFSWRKIPLTSLSANAASPEIVVDEGRIETPFHICTFDAATGRILSLYDKTLNWQVLDANSSWTLFQYVQETIDPLFHPARRETIFPRDIEKGNNSISVWNHQWQAKYQTCTRILDCVVERQEHAVSLVMRWDAPGVEMLEQKFTFFAYRPDIEMTATLQKQGITTPEGMYFALPLNLEASWRCQFDSAGQWAELDEQQLPGVCRDWLTVDKCVSMYDEEKGVTLACPDAPLVQVGNFHFGREQKAIARDPRPLLLAWPMNNYWDTNFRAQQPGFVSFTYSLSTFERFAPMEALAAGIRATSPAIMTPLVYCDKEEAGEWIKVEGNEAVVFDVKPALQGEGIILRLLNPGAGDVAVRVSFPSAHIQNAWLTDVLEEDREGLKVLSNGGIELHLGARQMCYVRAVISNLRAD